MKAVYFRFQPTKSPIRHFWSEFRLFCILRKILKFNKFHFRFDNSFFRFQPRKTQVSHFWSQIQELLFSFFPIFCKQKNSRMLISNMTTVFSYSSQQKPKQVIFRRKFRHFRLVFCNTLQIENFEDVDFKYDNSFQKFFLQNTQISHVWSQNQMHCFFCKMLILDKFEGAAFKYDNRFCRFQPTKTQLWNFWSQIY